VCWFPFAKRFAESYPWFGGSFSGSFSFPCLTLLFFPCIFGGLCPVFGVTNARVPILWHIVYPLFQLGPRREVNSGPFHPLSSAASFLLVLSPLSSLVPCISQTTSVNQPRKLAPQCLGACCSFWRFFISPIRLGVTLGELFVNLAVAFWVKALWPSCF